MKPITPAQLKKLNTIIHKRGISKDVKEAMLLGYTGGRATSSRDLYFGEAFQIINHLEQHDVHYASIQKMRGKILYYAHELGWRKTGNNGKMVADGAALDAWMIKYSYLHKKMDSYTFLELPKLVTQFEIFYKHFLNKI